MKGFSGKSFSDTSSNATQDNSNDLGDIRGLPAHDLNGSLNEIPVSVPAPVMVTASEVVSKLGYGVTTSTVTPSTPTVPSGLALAYG